MECWQPQSWSESWRPSRRSLVSVHSPQNFIHRFSWICDKMSSMSRMKHDKNLFMAFFATTVGKLRSCRWFHGVSAGGGLIHQKYNSICTFNLYHWWFQRPPWTWAFLLVSCLSTIPIFSFPFPFPFYCLTAILKLIVKHITPPFWGKDRSQGRSSFINILASH